MVNNTSAFLAIGLIAIILFATRQSGAEYMSKLNITPRIQAFLEAMSGSVIVAIIANEVVSGGFRTLAAVSLAGCAMLMSKNAVFAMLIGVTCAAVWNLVFM